MKKIILLSMFLLSTLLADHFNVNIEETGESTLFIFQVEITGLDLGDEVGLFDLNGIINDSGDTGGILVGSGIWDGSQLEVTAIHAVDLSQFGGPILPGAILNHPMLLSIWDNSEQAEYNANYTIDTGGGTFNGLFTVISSIDECIIPDGACDCSGNVLDECGICGGPGAIYECGCFEITEGFCDCEETIFEQLNYDCDGNCIAGEDCNGECGGDAVIDECGICDGPGAIYECICSDIPEGDCDCYGNVLDECDVCGGDNTSCLDCTGVPNGDAIVDNCGICDGDNSTCVNPEAVLSFYDMGGVVLTNISYETVVEDVCIDNAVLSGINGNSLETAVGECIVLSSDTGVIPVYMKNLQPIAGFQFNITGLTILEVSGGAAADAGFTVSSSENIVLGFSFAGGTLDPSGEFPGCVDINACNYDSWATNDDGSCEYPQFECEDGSFACDESNCIPEDCYDTDCGYYLLLGVTCEYAMEYGADCTLCDEQGYCDDDGGGGGGGDYSCPDGEIEDCSFNCSPESSLGNGYCDTISPYPDFNCLEFSYDMGDCDIVFSESIMPIISANCTGYCHTGTAPYTGGLNLESYSGLMEGGNSGDAVIPYDPDQSLIIQKLYGTAPDEQMPFQSPPLPDNQIFAIYYWIEQGAIGDDDDGSEEACTEGLTEDCLDVCVDETLLGNGNCDDGEEGEANFNCIAFYFDDTDCPVGELDFGNSAYNNDDGSGTIEILMNCAFPVSSFEIELTGVSISGLSGGTSEDSQFNLSYTENSFTGESVGFSNIDPNSGLLVVVEFDAIDPDTEEICFTNSLITTNIGVQYDAELGDCITIDQLGFIDINPEKFTISQIYPNPFNPITTISYSIPTSQHVVLNIYNLKGEKVETLINGFHSLGNYYIDWNASGVASGIYLVQLKGTDNLATKKITLSK